jgi:hypothetical protein
MALYIGVSMTTQPGAMVYTQGFGSRPENVEVPVISNVAPASNQTNYPLGKRWINTAANTYYVLTNLTTSAGITTATWTLMESGTTAFLSLTGDSGTALPSAGNVQIAGTANQITTTGSGSTVTISIPSSPSFGGNTTSATGFTATNGNFTATAAGTGLVLNSGTAAGTTTATLNGRSGQVTITTPTINAGSTFTFTLTNSSVTASTTQVLYGLTGGTTGSAITIQSVTNSASTSTIVLQNASAVTNSTGSLVLTFLVIN